MRNAKFRPHLPAHPTEEKAADELQPWNAEQICGDDREDEPQDGGSDNAEENSLLPQMCRKPGGGKPDNDCVVTGKNKIDRDDF
ncbi:hypothetical protein D3C80_353500 [compost metagenome]